MGKIYERERIVTNKDGEVLHIEKDEIFKNKFHSEPDYVKMYLKDIVRLHNCGKPAQDALACILRHMNYDNVVHLIKYTRNDICNCANVTDTHLRKIIAELKNATILISTDSRGTYIVNPYLFGKGKWQDIQKLRMVIEYTDKGRTIKAERISNIIKEERNK